MKRYFTHISAFTLILVLVFVVSAILLPQTAHAANFWDVVECTVSPLDCALRNLVVFIASTALQLVSLLTGLGATVLNGSVYYTVVKISDNYSGIPAINEAWKAIRDIANMGFIFILLYGAIQMILGIGSDIKKLIINIIVVAILINFSLFFTKIVIDISNILTLFFYDAIAPGATSAGFSLTQKGLSNAFMQHLELTSLYQASKNLTVGSVVTIGVMGSIMLLIAAFVFFAVAIMFIIRYVILILVLILSPLAFMAFILPQLKKYQDQWWEALSGQAFFAPIYFMLTWVTLRTLGGVTKVFGTRGLTTNALSGLAVGADGVTLSPGIFPTLINFIVVIVFLITSLIIAKQWADKAGPVVASATKWAMGVAGGASFGLAARAGRYTAGLGAEVFKESKMYKGLEAKSPDSMLARLTLAAADKTRKGSFDVRGSRLGGVLAGAGFEAGPAGGQGGFEAERTRAREFLEKPGTKSRKEREERARRAENELTLERGVAKGALPAEVIEMQRVVKDMTGKEIIALEHNMLATKELAEALTAQHLRAINDSDKSETEKREIFDKHFARVSEAVEAISDPTAFTALTTAQQAAHRNTLRNISEREMDYIPRSIFDPNKLDPTAAPGPDGQRSRAFMKTVTQSQVDNLIKGDNFIASEKQNIKDARTRPLNEALGIGPGGTTILPNYPEAIRIMGEMRPEALVQLDDDKLTDPNILTIYRPGLLNKMAARSELTEAKARKIREAILNATPIVAVPGRVVPPEITEAANWLRGDGLKIF